MALLTLLITIAIIVALFFAGRWLYRTITNDSTDNTATTDNNGSNGDQIDLPTFDGDIVGQGNQPNDTSDDSSNTSENTSNSTSESAGVVTDEAASTNESNSDRVAGANTGANSSSSTGSASTSGVGGEAPIPNTGAGDVLIVIPFVTAIAGYYISRRHYSKQN